MCGICGFIDTRTGHAADSGVLSAMNAAIVHRGPDEEGGHIDGGVALGSRRLSIIDLREGHMPMSNEDGSVWVVQNGEIYNFRELRADLEKLGHRFRKPALSADAYLIFYPPHDVGQVRKLGRSFHHGMAGKDLLDQSRSGARGADDEDRIRRLRALPRSLLEECPREERFRAPDMRRVVIWIVCDLVAAQPVALRVVLE